MAYIQVAFAGHNRSEDLGDVAAASAALAAAFGLLAEAGVKEGRLLTGLAPGADLLAARAWRERGLGPVHAVFPFLESEAPEGAAELMDAGTWLDGRSTEARGRNAHLAQTRWLIGAADLLVVVWTGEHARGAGGTADAVRLALEHGVPVLWIKPNGPADLRVIRPEYLDEDFGFLEFLEELEHRRAPLVSPASAEALRQIVTDVQGESGDHEALKDPPKRMSPIWRTYALFRRRLGGTPPHFEARPPPQDLIAQPGFQALSEAQARADARASYLGSVHRSQQIILLAVAIAAAVAGSASAVWPHLKLACVSIELVLALIALVVWQGSERDRRHEHWGRARRAAEDLRLERVAWTLGLSASPPGLGYSSTRQGRALRRKAGLPEGRFDAARVSAWGAWGVDELIVGQAAYHHAQAVINGRIAHRVHQFENASFGLLLVLLSGYVAAAIGLRLVGHEAPHWLAGIVAMAGAIVPAIGAATLALEATLALGEQAQRSKVLASRLGAIAQEARDGAGLEPLQTAVKHAIRLARAQEDHWLEGAGRRRLYRGG